MNELLILAAVAAELGVADAELTRHHALVDPNFHEDISLHAVLSAKGTSYA